MAFADALQAVGCEEVELDDASKFKAAAIRATGESFVRSGHRLQDSEILIGSHEPRPVGRVDLGRKLYLEDLCRFWDKELGREARASVTESGNADGPMVRFLIASTSAIFKMRGTAVLTAGGARGQIREYVGRRKKAADGCSKLKGSADVWQNSYGANTAFRHNDVVDPPA